MKRPEYLAFIAVATGIYLVVELAFNARLLDVAGGHASVEQIDSIERWGRFISGVAAVLACWGVIVLPRAEKAKLDVGTRRAILFATALICLPIVFFAERALVDRLAESSTREMRQKAVQLIAVKRGVLSGEVTIDGIDLNAEKLQKPEGKSFIALLPILAVSTKDFDRKIDDAVAKIARNDVTRRMGTAEELFERAYRPAISSARDAYNRYLTGDQSTMEAARSVPKQVDVAWNDYLKLVQSKGWQPERIPFYAKGGVRRTVQEKGIPVPSNWEPSDRVTFERVLTGKLNEEIRNRYTESCRNQIGTELPHGMDWKQFVAHPAMQAKLRSGLRFSGEEKIGAELSFEEFTAAFYTPMLEGKSKEAIAVYHAESAAFGKGGRYEQEGLAAVRGLLVPPIALCFSLLGALIHIFKFSAYVARSVSPRVWRNNGLIAVGLLILSVLVIRAKNEVTVSRVYQYFSSRTSTERSPIISGVLTWIVQAQPYAYPLNEFVRSGPLCGYGFGYSPGASGEAPSTGPVWKETENISGARPTLGATQGNRHQAQAERPRWIDDFDHSSGKIENPLKSIAERLSDLRSRKSAQKMTQTEKSATKIPPVIDSQMAGELFPETRRRRLSSEEVANWPIAKLRYAINEIYARRGGVFSEDIQRDFNRLAWYRPQPSVPRASIEAAFTDVERINVEILASARKKQQGNP